MLLLGKTQNKHPGSVPPTVPDLPSSPPFDGDKVAYYYSVSNINLFTHRLVYCCVVNNCLITDIELMLFLLYKCLIAFARGTVLVILHTGC